MDNAETPAVDVELLLAKLAETDPDGAKVLKELIDSGRVQIIALTEEKEAALVAAENFVKQIAILESDVATKATALTEAAGIIAGQRDTIAAKEAQIVELQTKPAGFPAFTLKKKVYEVTAGSFKFEGETYSAAQLLKDEALQKKLVEKGVGFITLKES